MARFSERKTSTVQKQMPIAEPTQQTQTMKKQLFLSIEGNIGVGKTTLVNRLVLSHAVWSSRRVHVEREPVAENPFLADFYRDPARFAFPLQTWMLNQRFRSYIRALQSASQGKSVIMDRSVWSDWVFARQAAVAGTLAPAQWTAYQRLAEKIRRSTPQLNTMVYLRVPAAECYRRVHRLRRRPCESAIGLDYLEGLHERHDELVQNEYPGPSVTLDWSSFGSNAAARQPVSDAQLPSNIEQLFPVLEAVEPVDSAALDSLDWDAINQTAVDINSEVHSLSKGNNISHVNKSSPAPPTL